jgi:hypothetical protein
VQRGVACVCIPIDMEERNRFVMANCDSGVCHKAVEMKTIRPGKERYHCGRRDKISGILHLSS